MLNRQFACSYIERGTELRYNALCASMVETNRVPLISTEVNCGKVAGKGIMSRIKWFFIEGKK